MSAPLSIEDLRHVLDHTRDLWEELRGRRIFVTGGTGFFGCWLLETFAFANDQLKLDAKLTALTRDPDAFHGNASHLASHPAIVLLQGNARDFKFPEGEFSHVIHAAVDYCAPLDLFMSNVEGAHRTLDFAVKAKTAKYLLTSSGAVYGPQPPEITYVAEDNMRAPDPMQIRSAYGEAKRASEFLCAAFNEQSGIETKIARGFAFVGPYLPVNGASAIGNFINDALRGGPININGDGTPYRSYLYGADLAIWLWTILFKGQACRPYNVGSASPVSIEETARAVADVVHPGAEIRIAGQPVPGQPAERYVPSIDRAREELGLEPWIDLHEGVRRTAEWHRKQTQ
jgi:dTDP-glucose 4,6-dehydratase